MLQDILLVVLAGTLAWFLVGIFPKREKTGTGAHRRSTPASPFRAVSVYPYSDCCQAAKAVNGKLFLSNDAPHLPLAECTAEKCQCVYRHHADRRTGNGDRRTIDTQRDMLLNRGGIHCRSGVGRRAIDNNSALTWT